jgi:hypothetical protein
VNVGSDEDFRLLVSWLCFTFAPAGPFPVLALLGEQGTAKSTTKRVLLGLVDPNECDASGTPKSDDDLCVAANGVRVLALDNLSHIKPWLSDALSRISTGSGWRKRTLYTNLEETLVRVCLPIVFSAINDVATRGDLLDRSLLVRLPVLPEEQRKDEEAFWQDYEAARPLLLGAVLDGVVAALANRGGVRIERLPRMADFARWAVGAEGAFGWPEGAFLAAYEQNREAANLVALDHAPIATHLRAAVLLRGGRWRGTASQLLSILGEVTSMVRTTKIPGWPHSPTALGAALVRLAPSLRRAGWTVEQPCRLLAGGRQGRVWLLAVPTGEKKEADEPGGGKEE